MLVQHSTMKKISNYFLHPYNQIIFEENEEGINWRYETILLLVNNVNSYSHITHYREINVENSIVFNSNSFYFKMQYHR